MLCMEDQSYLSNEPKELLKSKLKLQNSLVIRFYHFLPVHVLLFFCHRYYHIPNELKSESRAKQLIKSGRKLYVYNNHTFVAVKLPR